MEEILASIRRIINQDDADNNVARGPAAEVGDPATVDYPAHASHPVNGAAAHPTGRSPDSVNSVNSVNGAPSSHLTPDHGDPSAANIVANAYASPTRTVVQSRRPPPPGAPVAAYPRGNDPVHSAAPTRHYPAHDSYENEPQPSYDNAARYDARSDDRSVASADAEHYYDDDEDNGEEVLNLTEMVNEEGQVVSIQPAVDMMNSEDGYEDYYEQSEEFYETGVEEGPGAERVESPDVVRPVAQPQVNAQVNAGVPTQRHGAPASPFRTEQYSPTPDGNYNFAAGGPVSAEPAPEPEPEWRSEDRMPDNRSETQPTVVRRGSEPTRRTPAPEAPPDRTVASVNHSDETPRDTYDDDRGENRVDDRRRRPTGRINRAGADAFAELAGTEPEKVDTPPDMDKPKRTPSESVLDSVYNGDSALERMVHEALQPMLRDWLDKNLPVLIEQVVRKELQRIFEARNRK